jgi:hypothetical protein
MFRPFAKALVVVALASYALPAFAQDVIPQQPIKRKFPSGIFCALPVEIEFTAPVTAVVVTFTAEVFVPDPGNGDALTWTEQYIDNFTVAPSTLVDANFGPFPGHGEFDCYVDEDPAPVSYFFFNNVIADPSLKLERFDDDPTARGWSLGTGASFSATETAPRNVVALTDATGGSVALGDGTGTPMDGVKSSASVLVENLTVNTSYNVGAWWDCKFVRFPHDLNYLIISVTEPDGTPIARRTWGQIKATWK